VTQPSADHHRAFYEKKVKQTLTQKQQLKSLYNLRIPARIMCFTSLSCSWGWGFLCTSYVSGNYKSFLQDTLRQDVALVFG